MTRKKTLFDAHWRFAAGEQPQAEKKDFRDSNWRKLTLPHDFSVEGTFSQDHPSGGDGAYLPAGIGWYRKRFARPQGPIVRLTFDGVYQKSDVWLNGVHLGRQNFGYNSFTYDLTPHLADGENVLSVRVDNAEQPNSRWYSGSGIYRHVWLTQMNDQHVLPDSLQIETPQIDQKQAQVRATFALAQDEACKIDLVILDERQEVVSHKTLQGKAKQCCETLVVSRPKLWSAKTPHLHKLQVTLLKDGETIDRVEETFGIRRLEFDADRGFLINGQKEKLNGVCIHHDGGAVGAAVPEVIWQKRLELLKDMGCNAIRMAHNPPAPELLDLCDQHGFYVMDEAFDEWKVIKRKSENDAVAYGYGQIFEKDAEKDLIAMIRRDRNHPSIILWSIGNEIPEQATEEGVQIARRFVELCHREDPTRPVTSACDNVHADHVQTHPEFLKALDVAGFNYINRWRRHAETAYDKVRRDYPDMILLGTEHGGVGGVRGEYDLQPKPGKWWSFKYNSRMIRAEHLLKQTMIHDYILGDFMWTGIDYLGEARWPMKSAPSGLIDTCNIPKDGYYLYQSQWTKDPVLHLFPHWNLSVEVGTVVPVVCYTNCDEVELFLNGKSLGCKSYEFPMQGMTETYGHFDRPHVSSVTNDLHLSWDVPYEPGVLRAVGRDRSGQEEKVCEVFTTGKPASLRLPTAKRQWQEGFFLLPIEIIDSQGRVVPDADHEVTVDVSGGGSLAGLDNGDPYDKTPMQSPTRKVLAGKAQAVLRREQAGSVTVTVRAVGLQEAMLTIQG